MMLVSKPASSQHQVLWFSFRLPLFATVSFASAVLDIELWLAHVHVCWSPELHTPIHDALLGCPLTFVCCWFLVVLHITFTFNVFLSFLSHSAYPSLRENAHCIFFFLLICFSSPELLVSSYRKPSVCNLLCVLLILRSLIYNSICMCIFHHQNIPCMLRPTDLILLLEIM